MADLFYFDGYNPEPTKELADSSLHSKGKGISQSNSYGDLEQELLGSFLPTNNNINSINSQPLSSHTSHLNPNLNKRGTLGELEEELNLTKRPNIPNSMQMNSNQAFLTNMQGHNPSNSMGTQVNHNPNMPMGNQGQPQTHNSQQQQQMYLQQLHHMQQMQQQHAMREMPQTNPTPMTNTQMIINNFPAHVQTQFNQMNQAQRSAFLTQLYHQQQQQNQMHQNRQLRTSQGHINPNMVNYSNLNHQVNSSNGNVNMAIGNPNLPHNISNNPQLAPNSPYSPYSWNNPQTQNSNQNLNSVPFSPISSPPMNVPNSNATPPPFSPASNSYTNPNNSFVPPTLQRNNSGLSNPSVLSNLLSSSFAPASTPHSTSLINNLELECLSFIFSHLSMKDLGRVCLVCRRWNGIAWKSVEVVDLTQSWNFFTKPNAKHTNEMTLRRWFTYKFDSSKVTTINAWGCEAFNNSVLEVIAMNPGYQKNLKTLNVRMTRVNNDGVRFISMLTSLQHLTLMSSISDRDISVICKNLSQLQSLMLISSNIGDAGLGDIAQLRHLKELQLTGCERVGDSGIARLKPLITLKALWLSCTGVTDHGMQQLIALSNLKTLVVTNCKITDAGLKYLTLLEQLETLSLSYCYLITPSGVDQLPKGKLTVNLFGVRNASG